MYDVVQLWPLGEILATTQTEPRVAGHYGSYTTPTKTRIGLPNFDVVMCQFLRENLPTMILKFGFMKCKLF